MNPLAANPEAILAARAARLDAAAWPTWVHVSVMGATLFLIPGEQVSSELRD